MQGLLNPKLDPLYRECFKLKKKRFIEVDDLHYRTHEAVRKPKDLDYSMSIWQKADGFICSTCELAKHYKEFGKPCYVFRNYLDFNDSRWDVEKFETDRVIVGYMGYESHAKDLEVLKDVIPVVLNKYDNVDFQFLGYIPEYIKQNHRVRLIPTDNDISVYPVHLAQFDIGLIPLIDNEFNLCKSDLKFLEYGRIKAAPVVCQSKVYSQVTNKVNGLVVRQHKAADWIKAISTLVEDKAYRQQIGRGAYNYCSTRDIQTNIHKYIEILGKAVNDN